MANRVSCGRSSRVIRSLAACLLSLRCRRPEMYDEPFHVPEPDAAVFEETWEDGQRFRSGMIWNIGKGKVVYFRPGHETHAIYAEAAPMRIVENTIRWLGTRPYGACQAGDWQADGTLQRTHA